MLSRDEQHRGIWAPSFFFLVSFLKADSDCNSDEQIDVATNALDLHSSNSATRLF